jgi:tRNA pseudouridine38-40 synthase
MTDLLKQVCLRIAYIGDGFHGWQSQLDGSGIQDHIEKVLEVFLRERVRITGASRTDTGVHAEDQVACFRISAAVDLHRLVKGLNAMLPLGVRVKGAQFVPLDFHPILSATAKLYRYRIWRSIGETPFYSSHSWKWSGPLDLDRMLQASRVFVGTHDFSAFCAADSSAKTKVRTLYDIRQVNAGPLLELWFYGEGFLKQMIRVMVGTLMSVGQKKMSVDDVAEVLQVRDRTKAAMTAPADGLTLMKVCYGPPPPLDSLFKERSIPLYSVSLLEDWNAESSNRMTE